MFDGAPFFGEVARKREAIQINLHVSHNCETRSASVIAAILYVCSYLLLLSTREPIVAKSILLTSTCNTSTHYVQCYPSSTFIDRLIVIACPSLSRYYSLLYLIQDPWAGRTRLAICESTLWNLLHLSWKGR